MKDYGEAEQACERLCEMAAAPVRTRLLLAGIELGIFGHLGEFRSAAELAAVLGSHHGNTEKFLDGLVTIGLLEKSVGRYRNTEPTAHFLLPGKPRHLGPLLQMITAGCVKPPEDLIRLVLEGPDPDANPEDFADPQSWAKAAHAGAAFVAGGIGRKMAEIVSRLPDFSTFRTMLDLGGGHGMFAQYFLAAHPDLTAVIFDRPAVLKVAEQLAREAGLTDRLVLCAGDYLADDLGGGFDLIWASSTLNFARHDLDSLMEKIYGALNPNGVFASFQDGLTHEKTQPCTMLGHLSDALRSGLDCVFEQGEIAEVMLRCGFRSVHSRTIATPMGAMDLDIARK